MKGGTGPLTKVYRYADPVTVKGRVLMDTPGFDPVSATGQIAGGANLIALTTGRGSIFGANPVRSIKLATNKPMYPRHGSHGSQWRWNIGWRGVDRSVGREIVEAIIADACGRRTGVTCSVWSTTNPSRARLAS
jgi:altronate hydrolase